MKLFDLCKTYTSIEEMPSWALKQGISSLLYDEIVASGVNPLDRRGLMLLSGYAQKQINKWEAQKEAISSLANIYAKYGMKMMVFKGYALSQLYDVPSSRLGGDVDIYMYGDGERADKLLTKGGINVKLEADKHSSFYWKNVHFENHATFVTVRGVNSVLKAFENAIEKEALENSVEDEGIPNVYMPSATFNALFLPFHLANHWVCYESNLRQLYDWAVFLKKCSKDVDWKLVCENAEGIGFARYLHALNDLVVRVFEVEKSLIPIGKADRELGDMILQDVIYPKKVVDIPANINFLKGCFLKSIRFLKLSGRRNMVQNQGIIRGFYSKSLQYMHRMSELDKRSLWEMNHVVDRIK